MISSHLAAGEYHIICPFLYNEGIETLELHVIVGGEYITWCRILFDKV